MARADSGYMSQHDSIYSNKSSQSLQENYHITDEQEPANSQRISRPSYSNPSSEGDYNVYQTTSAYQPPYPPAPFHQPYGSHQSSGNFSRWNQATRIGPSPVPPQRLQPHSVYASPYSSSPRLAPPYSTTPAHSPRVTPAHSPRVTPAHSPRVTPVHSPRITPVHSPRITPRHSPSPSTFSSRDRDDFSSEFMMPPESSFQNNLPANLRVPYLPSNHSSASHVQFGGGKYAESSQYNDFVGMENAHFDFTATHDVLDEVYNTYHDHDETQTHPPGHGLPRQDHQRLQRLHEGHKHQQYQQYQQYQSQPTWQSQYTPTSEVQPLSLNPPYSQQSSPQSPQIETQESPQSPSSDTQKSLQSPSDETPKSPQSPPNETQILPQLGPTNQNPDLETNRNRAVDEIITTERTYVDGLKKLVDIFLRPLKENYRKSASKILSTKPMASLEDITAMFGNIELLLTLHEEQLLKPLQDRYLNGSTTGFISDIFLKIAPYLKMYTTYLKNFPNAIATMERLIKESQAFKKFLTQCSEKQELNGLGLNSFLILPIQRIPRYKLLLEALMKYTPDSHPEYKDLQKCVQQISVIADDVNEKIRDAENQQKVIEIQSKVEGLPYPIVKPARRFIYQGDLFKVSPRQKESARIAYLTTQDVRTHFLFNDLLLFCLNLKGEYHYKGQIDLSFASILNIEDWQADQPHCFRIVTNVENSVRTHTVRAASAEKKHKWMSQIDQAIQVLKKGTRMSHINAEGQYLTPIQQSTISKTSVITKNPTDSPHHSQSQDSTSRSNSKKKKPSASAEASIKSPKGGKKDKAKLSTFEMVVSSGFDQSFS